MTTKKKKGFLTFLCSLVPGAGEMYMGFMKQGTSLMLLFLGGFLCCVFFNFGYGAILLPVIWAYSFFHVHNLKGMSDEEFYQLKDEYLFEFGLIFQKLHLDEKRTKLAAWGCILVGGYSLWNILVRACWNIISGFGIPDWVYYGYWNIIDRIPQIILAALLIWFGIRLIKGKKTELDAVEGVEICEEKDGE